MALLRKETCNLRHPLHLRHSVMPPCVRLGNSCAWHDSFVIWRIDSGRTGFWFFFPLTHVIRNIGELILVCDMTQLHVWLIGDVTNTYVWLIRDTTNTYVWCAAVILVTIDDAFMRVVAWLILVCVTWRIRRCHMPNLHVGDLMTHLCV